MANKANKKVIAYAGGDHCVITESQAKMLTHINVAFGRLPADLSIDVSNIKILHDGTLKQVKEWNPDIKLILSLVSSEYSTWSVGASTEEGRAIIAENCVKVIEEYGFDGVDFDWEYPCVPSNGIASSPDDKHNFTLMLKAVRERLDTINPDMHYLVTIAAGADVYYCENVEMQEIIKYLDYINVMTYDLKCGFHALSGHHTNLFCSSGDYFHNSSARALQVFESYGVPKDKLLMGAGFYSRKWVDVPNVNNGFLQLTKNGGGYGPDYTILVEEYINKNGYTRYWDDEAKAPYLFNGSTFLSYDDVDSIKAKCEYVKEAGYAGIFYWEHKCDSTGILLETMDETFNA